MKSKYLNNLEALREAYSKSYGNCVGNVKIYKLALLFAMFENYELFKNKRDELKEKFIIDIDRDVEYTKWGDYNSWLHLKTKAGEKSEMLRYDAACYKDGLWFANRMADMLPPLPEENAGKPDTSMSLTYKEREKFKNTINNLINPEVFNDPMLDHTIDKSLKLLCGELLEIDKIVEGEHSNDYFARLFDEQDLFYSMRIGAKTLEEHNRWKKNFLDVKEINKETLQWRIMNALVELFQSGVFNMVSDATGKKQKEAYRKEISFEDLDEPKDIKKLYKNYALFRGIYSYENGEYSVNKVKAGKLLRKIRKDTSKIEAFFKFHQTLNHVYMDMDGEKDTETHGSDNGANELDQLTCHFSKEQQDESGISYRPDIVLAVIDSMQREKIPNTYWLAFFCVLLQKQWIDDNVRAFASNMSSIFDIKLDHSALSRSMKDLGNDIDQWPEEDGRVRKKKAFGQEFQNRLDAYIKCKKMAILNDTK